MAATKLPDVFAVIISKNARTPLCYAKPAEAFAGVALLDLSSPEIVMITTLFLVLSCISLLMFAMGAKNYQSVMITKSIIMPNKLIKPMKKHLRLREQVSI